MDRVRKLNISENGYTCMKPSKLKEYLYNVRSHVRRLRTQKLQLGKGKDIPVTGHGGS
jgi:hypothetical protein